MSLTDPLVLQKDENGDVLQATDPDTGELLPMKRAFVDVAWDESGRQEGEGRTIFIMNEHKEGWASSIIPFLPNLVEYWINMDTVRLWFDREAVNQMSDYKLIMEQDEDGNITDQWTGDWTSVMDDLYDDLAQSPGKLEIQGTPKDRGTDNPTEMATCQHEAALIDTEGNVSLGDYTTHSFSAYCGNKQPTETVGPRVPPAPGVAAQSVVGAASLTGGSLAHANRSSCKSAATQGIKL